MQLVPYIDVQRQAAEALGTTDAELLPEDQKALQRNISRTLRRVWQHFWWPDVMRMEERAFRDAYDSATTYAALSEVFFTATQKYYVALRATTGNDPADADDATNLDYWAETPVLETAEDFSLTKAYAKGDKVYYPTTAKTYQAYAATVAGTLPTDTTKWGEVPVFDRYVHKLQPGKTKIGQVRRVWDKDPRRFRDAKRLDQRDGLDKVQVLSRVATCWVEFKLRPPRLSGDVWDATLIYTAVSAEEGGSAVPTPVTSPLRLGLAGVAALRAKTDHVDDQIEFLLYHTSADDGGQGSVYYDAASTVADDNGQVFKPNNVAGGSPGRWVRV